MRNPKIRRAKEIQKQIRSVLNKYWDPLNVFNENIDGEYDSVIGGIYHVLERSNDHHELTIYLNKASKEYFGVDVSGTRNEFVAKKLSKLDISYSD